MVTWSISSYSVRVRAVTRPIAPAPPRTIICMELAPRLLCYRCITISFFHCGRSQLITNGKAGSRNGGIQLLEGILQTVQDGIDLFTCDDQRRHQTDEARIIVRISINQPTLEDDIIA